MKNPPVSISIFSISRRHPPTISGECPQNWIYIAKHSYDNLYKYRYSLNVPWTLATNTRNHTIIVSTRIVLNTNKQDFRWKNELEKHIILQNSKI